MHSWALLLLAASFGQAPEAPTAPLLWYDDPRCAAVAKPVQSFRFETANRELIRMESDPDPRAKACAVFHRVMLAEMFIAAEGLTPGRIEYRDFYLQQMLALAHTYGALGEEFKDLAMEAHTRSVRAHFDAGRRMDAVSAARTAFAMLQTRRGARTPTVQFVSGAFDSAVGHSPLPVRILFGMAGIEGDLGRGHRAIMGLIDGKSVYRYDALYMAFHFARSMDDSPFGRPLRWAERLHRAASENPQYSYDVAESWRAAGDCPHSLDALGPALSRLEADAERWTPMVRAKLYWLAGRCALDLGQREVARGYAQRCRAQREASWIPLADELLAELEG